MVKKQKMKNETLYLRFLKVLKQLTESNVTGHKKLAVQATCMLPGILKFHQIVYHCQYEIHPASIYRKRKHGNDTYTTRIQKRNCMGTLSRKVVYNIKINPLWTTFSRVTARKGTLKLLSMYFRLTYVCSSFHIPAIQIDIGTCGQVLSKSVKT